MTTEIKELQLAYDKGLITYEEYVVKVLEIVDREVRHARSFSQPLCDERLRRNIPMMVRVLDV